MIPITKQSGMWKASFNDDTREITVTFPNAKEPFVITYELVNGLIADYDYMYICIAETSDKLYITFRNNDFHISLLKPFDKNQVVWKSGIQLDEPAFIQNKEKVCSVCSGQTASINHWVCVDCIGYGE